MSRIINRGKIRFYNHTLHDDDANDIYDKVIGIIARDTKFTFKYNRVIDGIKYKVNGIVKMRFRYDRPHIYFINLKFISDNIWQKDERFVQIMVDTSTIRMDINNWEFITGDKIDPNYTLGISVIPKPNSFINTFKRIDKDHYLVDLILGLFNGAYSHGSMMVPSIDFIQNYENVIQRLKQ